jgi:homoserine dehydrogenase
MSRKKINIGLFGFGCVGFGLYEVLQRTPRLEAHIKTICVKNKDKERPIPAEHFSFDKDDILQDADINVVVELIDDADAAYEIVTAALRSGKAVVSANKKMIAEHFNELVQLQRKYNVPLLYEAACCASMPIIRNLEEYYDNDLLHSIEGIVNGSTNYILTKTSKENISYAEALALAQQNGFAESDPTLDTGGFDAKYKLLILLAHAFGLVVKPGDIFNSGIDGISHIELNYAREKGFKIKLVAHAWKTAQGIACLVLPKFVNAESKLYTVDDVYNGVITQTSFADLQFFVGKGAGAHPTASAVLSDISALSYDYRYEYKKLDGSETLLDDSDIVLKIFLRHDLEYGLEFKRYFQSIHECWLNHECGFIIGTITLKDLKTIAGRRNAESCFVLFGVVEDKEAAFVEEELAIGH